MFKISEKSKDKLANTLLAMISISLIIYIFYKVYEMINILMMLRNHPLFLS